MNTNNFTRMTQKQKEDIYGGWAWALLAPFIISSIAQAVSSFKMATSNSGSVKVSGYESHWDNKPASSSSKSSSSETKTTNVYYAY